MELQAVYTFLTALAGAMAVLYDHTAPTCVMLLIDQPPVRVVPLVLVARCTSDKC